MSTRDVSMNKLQTAVARACSLMVHVERFLPSLDTVPTSLVIPWMTISLSGAENLLVVATGSRVQPGRPVSPTFNILLAGIGRAY
jgi:hypothetical protein